MKINTIILFAAVFSLFSSNIVFTIPVFAENNENDNFEAPHVPNEIIIGFKPGTTQTGIENFYDKFFQEYEITELERFSSSKDDPGDRLVSISHPATKGILQKLTNDPRVEFAEYNYIVTIDVIPNDSRFGELWGMHNTGQTGGYADADIDAPEAWGVTTGSRDIIIGVIDTGVDYTHPDLVENIWVNPGEIAGNGVDDDGNGYVDDIHGWNARSDNGDPMDDHDHGTHVAGTIGAKGNNANGVVGVNWNVSIAGCKFLSAQGSGSTADAIKCFNYFTNLKAHGYNVLITSNSWGGGGYSTSLYNSMNAFSGLHMAAAGNSNVDTDASPHYPSSYSLDNIISVASTTKYDTYSSFSNYGATSVDIAAPGSSILSTVVGGGYSAFSGTSMATPHVAGAAGLIWSLDENLTASEVKNLILSNGDSVYNSGKPTLTNDRLNVFQSLLSTTPNDPPTANAGPDQTTGINEGDLVNMAGSGSDPEGQPITYSWTQASTDSVPVSLTGANTATPSFTAPESNTNYDVNLTLTVSDGIKNDQDSVLITIIADNDAPISDAGGPYEGTEGIPISFSGSLSNDIDGTIESYLWDFGDGNYGSGENPTHTYAQSGDYTVYLTVTDNDGLTSSPDSSNVKVNPAPDPFVDITSPSDDGTIVSGKITITADVIGASPSIVEFSLWDARGENPVLDLADDENGAPYSTSLHTKDISAGTYTIKALIDLGTDGIYYDFRTIIKEGKGSDGGSDDGGGGSWDCVAKPHPKKCPQ